MSKVLFPILFFIFISGCASIQPSVGKLGSSTFSKIESKVPLYAQLINGDNGWELKNVCERRGRYAFSSGYSPCKELSDPWNSYVSLNSMLPVFSTGGYICNTVLFQHYASKSRTGGKAVGDCQPADYWEDDIAWGEFGQWLFIMPILGLAYYEEIYLNYDELTEAINEATLKLDREKIVSYVQESHIKNKRAYEIRLAEKMKNTKAAEERKRKQKANEKLKRQLAQKKKINSFNAHRAGKALGSEVCSVDNRFGYLERFAGNKIQVRLKGVVSEYNVGDYYLFSSDSSFKFNAKEEIIWDSEKNWATCDLSNM